MDKIYISGIYHGDIQIDLGAHTSERAATEFARAVSEKIDGTCHFIRPWTVVDNSVQKAVKAAQIYLAGRGILDLEAIENKVIVDKNGYSYRPYDKNGDKVDIESMMLELPNGDRIGICSSDAGYMLENGYRWTGNVIYSDKA